MVGWLHWLDRHEFEQALGVGDGRGSLACCNPWGCKELEATEWPNWTELKWYAQLNAAALGWITLLITVKQQVTLLLLLLLFSWNAHIISEMLCLYFYCSSHSTACIMWPSMLTLLDCSLIPDAAADKPLGVTQVSLKIWCCMAILCFLEQNIFFKNRGHSQWELELQMLQTEN